MLPGINFLGVVLFLFASCQRSNVDSANYTPSRTADSIINAANEVRLNGQENLYIQFLDSAYNAFPDARPQDLWKKYRGERTSFCITRLNPT